MYPITGQCQPWTNNNPWAVDQSTSVDQSRVDIVQKTRAWTRGIEIWLRNKHIIYCIISQLGFPCVVVILTRQVSKFYSFCWLGSRAQGASILYPKSARTQPKNELNYFSFRKETHWVRIWHFSSMPNSMTFFTPENVGFPMCFYGEVNLRQDTTRCVSAGEALRSPRPTPPRPQSATAAATGGALPSGYLT
jgi:hypothetical protein